MIAKHVAVRPPERPWSDDVRVALDAAEGAGARLVQRAAGVCVVAPSLPDGVRRVLRVAGFKLVAPVDVASIAEPVEPWVDRSASSAPVAPRAGWQPDHWRYDLSYAESSRGLAELVALLDDATLADWAPNTSVHLPTCWCERWRWEFDGVMGPDAPLWVQRITREARGVPEQAGASTTVTTSGGVTTVTLPTGMFLPTVGADQAFTASGPLPQRYHAKWNQNIGNVKARP